MCITKVHNCHNSKDISSSDKKEEPIPFELRQGALCFNPSPQILSRNNLIDHWNHLSLNFILYGKNFRFSWRFIVTEGHMYGREHHVVVICIANFSKILTASIFKTRSLHRDFYLYLTTSLIQAGGYPGQDFSCLLPEYV